MAFDDYTQSVGQYSTLKTVVGGAQPTSHIKCANACDYNDFASSMAQQKAGNPHAYEWEPTFGDIGEGMHGSTNGGNDKKPSFFGRFKVPLIVSGLLVTVVGAVLAIAKQSKDAEDKEL